MNSPLKSPTLFGVPQPVPSVSEALRACREHLVTIFWFSALLNLLFVIPMLYMLQIYDRVIPTRGAITLLFLTIVLLFGLGTMALLDLARSRLLARVSVRLERCLAGTIIDTSLALSANSNSTVAREAMREFDTLRQALCGTTLLALVDAPWSPIYVLLCFLIHPLLGLMLLVGAGALAIITRLNQQVTRLPSETANEAAANAYNSQDQVLQAAENVRVLGMRRAIVDRHLKARSQVIALQTGASLAGSQYISLGKALRLALQSLALGLGAWLAIHDEISIGAIFASSFLAGRALQPVDQLLGSWPLLARIRVAYLKLNELLVLRDAGTSQIQLPRPKGRIEAEGLSIGSPTGQGLLLSNISFRVEPGEVVAIVGPSGAGKSTLLRALAGALSVDRGTVRFDGAKLADWDQERLGQYIGYLPQNTALLAGSVKENISRFQKGANVDHEVIAAAQAAGVHEMILRLPNGYETELGWGGIGLSSGQAQRIGLARALFRSPPIVLLDEPNAHLDAAGEEQLVRTLAHLKEQGAAVVIVSHRAGIRSAVDKLLVLQEGRIERLEVRKQVKAAGMSPDGGKPVEATECAEVTS